jgi:protein-S-isoprenylcysteine O-methyltransferase Ste14
VDLLVCFFILHARLWVHSAPGFPCALGFSRRKLWLNLDVLRRGVEYAYLVASSRKPSRIQTMTLLLRLLPLACILSVFLVGVLGRALLQRMRFGSWGIVRPSLNGSAQARRVAAFVVVFILLGVQGLGAARSSVLAGEAWLSPQGAFLLALAGAIILVAGFLLFVTAQWQMGASWRIGIDESARPGLVVSGLFSLTRNPIYLSLLLIVTGYLALLPTLWSLLLWCATYVLIRLLVAAEEDYLRASYGDAYEAYARRVGRLLPCFGWS